MWSVDFANDSQWRVVSFTWKSSKSCLTINKKLYESIDGLKIDRANGSVPTVKMLKRWFLRIKQSIYRFSQILYFNFWMVGTPGHESKLRKKNEHQNIYNTFKANLFHKTTCIYSRVLLILRKKSHFRAIRWCYERWKSFCSPPRFESEHCFFINFRWIFNTSDYIQSQKMIW